MAKTIRKQGRANHRAQPTAPGVFEPVELLPPTRPTTALARWAPIVVTAVWVVLAYIPTFDNGFVSWDDDHYIFNNPQVSLDDGIKSVWFDVIKHSDPKFRAKDREDRVSHQYYPMVFTIYWIEFRFHKWFAGADPLKTVQQNIDAGNMTATSFHVVGVVMHAVNVMLLIFCFRALGVSNWAAWAATILFALHPMQVATVAWAAERKNIISLMFYMLSMLTYIKLRREGGWWRYVLALVLFQAALFSKTVALTLPVVLFFTDRLLERKWDPRLMLNSAVRLLPFVVLSCLAAYTTMKVEDRERTIPLSEEQRPFIPCAALLFYVYKMLIPIDQSPVYRLWEPDPANFAWYLPILAVLLLTVLIVMGRRRLGSHFIWGLLFYVVTLGPMLGFKNINYFQFAFVADHYFYHDSVGLFLAAALALDALRRRIVPPRRGDAVMTVVVAALAVACAAKTWTYSDVWQDADTFWARTKAMNDRCWPAYFNTSNARLREAHAELDPAKRDALLEEAVAGYTRVAEIHRQIAQPFDQLLDIRRLQKRWDDGFEVAREATRRFSHLPKYWAEAGVFAAQAGRFKEAIPYFFQAAVLYERQQKYNLAVANLVRAGDAGRRSGRTSDSIKYFRQAGDMAVLLADAKSREGDDCAAAKGYQNAARYYATALDQDKANVELQGLTATTQQRFLEARARCGDND